MSKYRDLTEGEKFSLFELGRCPSCGATEYIEGPTGPGMINISCPGCEIKLNVAVFANYGQVLHEPEGYKPPKKPMFPRLSTFWKKLMRGVNAS